MLVKAYKWVYSKFFVEYQVIKGKLFVAKDTKFKPCIYWNKEISLTAVKNTIQLM